ncbi:hypothetical protein V9T40_010512 [Parthenolecanium corni]|uniref:Uncharacterized protein n=1 Tax=Parthenolecanium corni TaxID=536013 RepID=A0AAN9T5C4_9HEMI
MGDLATDHGQELAAARGSASESPSYFVADCLRDVRPDQFLSKLSSFQPFLLPASTLRGRILIALPPEATEYSLVSPRTYFLYSPSVSPVVGRKRYVSRAKDLHLHLDATDEVRPQFWADKGPVNSFRRAAQLSRVAVASAARGEFETRCAEITVAELRIETRPKSAMDLMSAAERKTLDIHRQRTRFAKHAVAAQF